MKLNLAKSYTIDYMGFTEVRVSNPQHVVSPMMPQIQSAAGSSVPPLKQVLFSVTMSLA
jgi:hypothetical protein